MTLELARRCFRALETYKDVFDGITVTPEQRADLREWKGWGPLAPALERYRSHSGGWAELREQVTSLLTPTEERHAVEATATAFYTSPAVTVAVWGLLAELGFTGGRVLEPGCGSGVFIDHAPANMPIDFTGVEIDPVTAGIAKLLHPDATIINAPLEKTALRMGSFDAVVGNVPFAEVTPYDPLFPTEEAQCQPSLHNYFLWRAVEATRPGGIVALVTSRYTMDAENPLFRRFISRYATFVGAIRLPTGAFGREGTDVVTDIVVLRRHTGDEPEEAGAWEHAREVANLRTTLNEYWFRNRHMVLGALRPKGAAHYGMTLDVVMPDGANVTALLDEATARLRDHADQAGLLWLPDPNPAPDLDGEPRAPEGREGSFTLHEDGAVTRIDGGRTTQVRATAELKELILLRDAAVALFDTEGDTDAPDEDIAPLRTHTRALYEGYVRRFGPLNRSHVRQGKLDEETGLPTLIRSTPSLGGIRIDPDFPTLLAIEDWDDDTEEARPAPILLRRVNRRPARKTHADSPAEAVALCIDELGRFDLERAAELLGTHPDEALVQLGDLVFRNPATLEWETADEYLSGDVREKLKRAQRAAEGDPDRWGRNVAALADVQPEDLGPFEIQAKLGAPWIPAGDIVAFVSQLLDTRADWVTVKHEPYTASWEVTAPGGRQRPASWTVWGTARVNAVDLIQHALNGSAPVVYDKEEIPDPDHPGRVKEIRVRNNTETQLADERLKKIQEKFGHWLWSDPDRTDRLVTYYNETYNAVRLRTFDGAGLTFPGLVDWFKPYEHQTDMVARIVATKGATLCGYGVGAGKTAIMYLAAMIMKRLGLIKKPVIIVPNHLLEQVAADGRRLFPAAKVLMVTKEDLTKKRRKAFAAKVAAADWDVIVMTHDQFRAIPVSPYIEAQYLADLIEKLQDAVNDDSFAGTRTAKRIAKQIMKLKARHAKLMDIRRDDGLFFDRLGIDYVFADEAHFFKNLAAACRMEGFSMPGSKRAEDLHIKLGWLRRRNPDGRCATLFTGTPVTNTLAEVYTLLRYLNPDLLDRLGMASFDAFAGMFIVYESKIEVAPDGSGFRLYRRPSKFSNVPELRLMLGENADIRTRRQLKLAGPKNVVRRLVAVEPPPELEAVIADLVERADTIRNGGVRPDEDNMLKVCTEGRKAALDLRLVGITPGAPGKVERVAREVATIYHAHCDRLYPWIGEGDTLWMDRPGAFQLVFCDLGTPGSEKGDQAYGWMKAEMIRLGVPADQIRYIHDADSDADKKALFAACRDGRISVLIASTEKAGTGVNVQHRLVAIHHVDATWRPDGIEQRDGRGDRPGNSNDTLLIFQYVTTGSFDPYMWQGLERKKRFIDQITEGEPGVREIADVPSADEQYYAMIKAVATGQERIMELEQAKADVVRLQNLATEHARNQTRLRNEQDHYGQLMWEARRNAKILEEVAAIGGPRHLDHWSHSAHGPEEAAKVLAELGRKALAHKQDMDAGKWRGVEVILTQSWSRGKPTVGFKLSTPRNYRGVSFPPVNGWRAPGQEGLLLAAIDAAIDGAAVGARQYGERADYYQSKIDDVQPLLGVPFEREVELEMARARRDAIEAEIAAEMEPKVPDKQEAAA